MLLELRTTETVGFGSTADSSEDEGLHLVQYIGLKTQPEWTNLGGYLKITEQMEH